MAFSAESTSGSQGTPAVSIEKKSASSISPIPSPAQADVAASQTQSPTLDRDDNGNDNDTKDLRSKKPKKKGPKKKSLKQRATALDSQAQIVRDQISALKDQLQTTPENNQEYEKTQYAIQQLEQVYAKLNAPVSPLAQPPPPKRHGLTSDETLTMLHFFYMVRLIQQGFFSLVPDLFTGMETEAVAYFCDKLVGSSLVLTPSNGPKRQVFDLLRKLHDGADEPVGPNYTTTYSQIRRAVQHAIRSSLRPPPPPSEQQHILALQPPVWVVVPFNSMIDFQQQSSLVVAAAAAANYTSTDQLVKSTDAAEAEPGSHPAQSTRSNRYASLSLSVSTKENRDQPCQDENADGEKQQQQHEQTVDGEQQQQQQQHTEDAKEEHSNPSSSPAGEEQHHHNENTGGEGHRNDDDQPHHTENTEGESDQTTDDYFEGGASRGGRGGRGRGSRGRGYRRGRGRGRGLYPPRGGSGRGFSRGDGAGKIWVPRENTS